MGNANQRPPEPSRLPLLLAWLSAFCLCLPAAPASARPAAKGVAAPSYYQQALDSFQHTDYARALALLNRAPASPTADPKTRADLLNLRGAIYLRQGRLEKARPLFTQVIALDPDLWAARFNLAEVAFRQKRYAESRRQFEDVLGRTSRSHQPDEWALTQYKMLLSAVLDGKDAEIERDLARLGEESKPPLDCYYLRAAIAQRHDQADAARQELAKASAVYPADAQRAYAESFEQLGWSTDHSARVIAAVEQSGIKALPVLGPSASPLAVSLVRRPVAASPTATVAMVQLMPAQSPPPPHDERPAFRAGLSRNQPPPPSANPAVSFQNAPPAPEIAGPEADADDIAPGLLARKRPAAAKPSPSPADVPADAASPSATAAPSAAAPTPAPSATPSPDPASPAFLQKYEAAYIKFLEKDFPGALALLREADLIQPHQPASIDLRNKIFSYYYKIAYTKYSEKDYTASQSALDDADNVQKDQPDSLNLRGLIYSRQRTFDQAEVMFKKAVQADPTFWAAKFNMAELPFTYKNYTVARSRYEQLLAETDASKQPREAELTQFKVFLTLLLEGKVDAARAFMDHFSFTGATPARYYCEAALDFYAGDSDKANESIAAARKDFPAQIEAIFADSFYRVGWLTDPNKTGASAVAAAGSPSPSASASPSPSAALAASSPGASGSPSPAPTTSSIAAATPGQKPAASPSPSTSPALVAAAATPARTPAASPSPAATPIVVAMASPTKTPALALSTPAASPTAAPVKPSLAASTPPPLVATKPPPIIVTPAPALATPAAQPSVAIAVASPSPAPTVAAVVATPVPKASPAASAAPSPKATPEASAAPEESPVVAASGETPDAASSDDTRSGDAIRIGLVLVFLLMFAIPWIFVINRAKAIKAERRKPALHYGGRKKAREEADAPR